jgi:hypothetical protein
MFPHVARRPGVTRSRPADGPFRRCFYYLLAVVLCTYIFSAGLSLASDKLYIYIPISANVGIALGNGLEHAWSTAIINAVCLVRTILAKVVLSVLQLLGADISRPDDLLPFHNRAHPSIGTHYSPISNDGSTEGADPPRRSTRDTPLALPAGQSREHDNARGSPYNE